MAGVLTDLFRCRLVEVNCPACVCCLVLTARAAGRANSSAGSDNNPTRPPLTQAFILSPLQQCTDWTLHCIAPRCNWLHFCTAVWYICGRYYATFRKDQDWWNHKGMMAGSKNVRNRFMIIPPNQNAMLGWSEFKVWLIFRENSFLSYNLQAASIPMPRHLQPSATKQPSWRKQLRIF